MAMFLESADRSQRIPLDRESIFLGSSERKSDFCLAGPDIADVHCELNLQADCVRIVALVDRGVTINGEAIREATLQVGDELGIASLSFRLIHDIDHGIATLVSEPSHADFRKPVDPQRSRWIVRVSGMSLGPLDRDELQTMISRGEVRLDDDVRQEHETAWHAVRDVMPDSSSDAWLCDERPVEPADQISTRRSRRRTARNVDVSETAARTVTAIDSGEPDRAAVATDENDAPLAPQFFIRRGDDELGPLPRQSIQDLADEGSLHADTPVRLEDSEEWSTAAAVGFHCSFAESTTVASIRTKTESGGMVAGGAVWILFAPYFHLLGLFRSLASLDGRKVAKWGIVVAVIVAVTFNWVRSWSQTAMQGTITLDGQPVADVLVQLTGAGTGDSAMGVSSSNGSFRVVTLDGELKPGLYLVTVRPVSELQGSGRSTADASVKPVSDPTLPEHYRHINTTDATIEITAEQSQYAIELTAQPRSRSVGFRSEAASTSYALP